jgi:hypothetical protein
MVHAGLMEKIMSKTNDTTKTRELTEAELAVVSGGVMPENILISGYHGGNVGGSSGSGSGSGSGFAGWDLKKSKG